MNFALGQYTRGYNDLLAYAKDNLETIKVLGKYREKSTAMSIGGLLPQSNCEIHSSGKDSLRRDVAANLASYFELVQVDSRTSFPTGRDPSPEADWNALANFIAAGIGNDDFETAQARLLSIARGSVMPLYFSRADGASQTSTGGARNRNFSLLTNPDKDKLLAALWLLPTGHELCQPLQATQNNLVRIDTGELFTSNSKTAILVPLQVGRNGWQSEKFLDAARNGSAKVKTAYLVRNDRSGEYFMHVAFEFECKEKYKPQAHLGVDKGILFTVAYGLVDAKGQVLDYGHFTDDLRDLQIKHGTERGRLARNGRRITRTDYKRQAYEQILHSLANKLIAIAIEHQAGIVVENLDNIRVKGKQVQSRFRKLDRYLEYKCILEGVPFRRVFAAYSSMICHKCGELLDRDDRVVVCNACGYNGHSDDNAAVNIARRVLYRKKEWEGGYRAFHRSFANTSTL